MSISKVPKSVTKIWNELINAGYDYLTTNQLAEKLDMEANSVLQNVRRNEKFFDIIEEKPILIGVKRSNEFINYRDKYRCTYCGKQLSKVEALVDNLDKPKQKTEPSLFNTATCCNNCKSLRGQKEHRNLTAEEFVSTIEVKDVEKALQRIIKIREIKNIFPTSILQKQKFTPRAMRVGSQNVEEQVDELRNEIVKLQELVERLIQKKRYEYYQINMILDEYYDDETGEELEYWRWDWNIEKGNIEEDYDLYWYLSHRGKLTKQGKPKDVGLAEVLDYFGLQEFEVVTIKWLDDNQFNEEIDVIFKKEI